MAGLAQYRRTLAAGESQNIAVRGTTVVLRDATAPVELQMRQNQVGSKQGTAYKLELRRGEKWFGPEEYDEVVVRNLGVEAQTIVVLLGTGDYVAPPQSAAVADIFRGHPRVAVDNGASESGGSLIAPYNGTRKKLTVRLPIDATGWVLIGGTEAEVIAGEGLTLNPGESVPIEAYGEVWGIAENNGEEVETVEELNL